MSRGRTEPQPRRKLLLAGLGLVVLLGLLAWLRPEERETPPAVTMPGAIQESHDRAPRAADDAAIAEPGISSREDLGAVASQGTGETPTDVMPAAAEALFVLTGLAVDEEGRPLSRASFDWIVLPIRVDATGRELVSGIGPKGSAATNEGGRFEIEVKRPKKRDSGFLELTLTTPTAQGRRAIECLELPHCDVGVVRLARPPVLLGGIVVDPEGRPIAGAYISSVDRASVGGTDMVRTGPLPKGRSGEDGRFALRGHSRAHELTFWVHHDRHMSDVREGVLVPVEDLRIVLAPSKAPSVRVRLLLDPLACTEGLMVWLHHPKLQEERFWMLPFEPDVWELPRLLPGTCDIEITACGESLMKLGNVDVPPSGPSLDPRLDGVDLRNRLECVRIHLVSDSGEPLPRGEITLGVPGGSTPAARTRWTHVADDEGAIALVKPIGSKIVVTDCKGAQVELVEGLHLCVTP